jgi:arabinofuranan 3-O-arabinosyltransferase
MTIRVVEATKLSFRTLAGPTPAPVVIGDIAVEGEAWDTVDQSGVAVPCGFGPRLQVNGTEYPTRVSGTRSALVNGQPLDLEVCGPVQLGAGTQRLRLLASTEFAVRTLSLRAPDEAGAGTSSGAQPGAAVSVERWNPTSRAVRVERSDRPQLVVVRENANPGWRAEAAGRRLEAVTADGWSQGWVVPAGTSGEVTMEFTPQTPFRVALLLGLLGALLAVWFARPRARLANAPVLREGSPPGWVHGVATLAAGSLLAGMWGLAAAALALVVTVVAPRRGVVMALVAGGIGLVGWSMVAPWPRPAATNRDVVSQLLACLLVALVVASPLRALWGRRERQALRRSERERSVGSDAPRGASSPLRSAR